MLEIQQRTSHIAPQTAAASSPLELPVVSQSNLIQIIALACMHEGESGAVALAVSMPRCQPLMRPGTPLLQRLLPLLLVSLRQLDAPVERVKHALELVEGRECL